MRLAVLAGVCGLLATTLGPCSMSEQQQHASKADKTGITLEESKQISPFPPKKVEVAFEGGRAVVKWTEIPDESIVGYVVYRSTNGSRLEKLGRVKAPPFVDVPPRGKEVSYAVAAVDSNDTVGRARKAQP